ncbi:hypothetical protein [Mycolicibacterium gadium]|uniref:Uncharacterized protein n=1 Tax=Mycolicibacterium gadium TaxID=1794 RepID=A0ABT6GUV9_MYCGU|nr:hypothetical protein [Mycolicibacterium gadium]MDG5485007.1 hypothetical protein [Mycolicibacterium gadium]
MKSTQLKLGAATLGTSALLAMGAMGVAAGVSSAQEETEVPSPEITLGETTTSTTAPPEPETPVAVPEVTAEPAPTG